MGCKWLRKNCKDIATTNDYINKSAQTHKDPGRFNIWVFLNGLFENQLGEAVETVLPNNEVMTFVRIVDEGARNAVLVAEGLELGAVANEAVGTTTYHPQELVLFLHLLYIRNELGCTHGIGC